MKLEIIVHPNSKHPRIESDLTGMTHVYVSEPPLEGKANQGVLNALAKHYKTQKSKIIILSGHKSKQKIVEIKEL